VSEADTHSPRYRLSYSGHVRAALRELITKAYACGLGPPAIAAVKVIDERLQVYPQFGEQRRDLLTKGHSQWTLTIPPLVVDYVIDEEHRFVFIVEPFRALPHSGL
jgi:hypothetical protein